MFGQMEVHGFPKSIVKRIDEWRITNAKRFASAEIFWEEFLTFIQEILDTKFHVTMGDIIRHNTENNQEALKAIKADQKDIWYGLDKINTTLAGLIEIASKPRFIVKSKKK